MKFLPGNDIGMEKSKSTEEGCKGSSVKLSDSALVQHGHSLYPAQKTKPKIQKMYEQYDWCLQSLCPT